MVDILEVTYSKLTYSTSPTRSTIFLLSAMRNVELQRLFTNKGGVEIHHPSETSLALRMLALYLSPLHYPTTSETNKHDYNYSDIPKFYNVI